MIRAHHRFERRADGHVARLWLTLDPVAAGGDDRTGLPTPREQGRPHQWSELPLQPDPQATVCLVDDVRSLFGGAPGRTNVDPAQPTIAGDRLEVELTWGVPVSLAVAHAPFDLFIFRTETASHEVLRGLVVRPHRGSNSSPLRSIGGSATNLGTIGALAFCP